MLYEAKEVPLKLRFSFLTCKFIIKSLARKFKPVIESLDALRLAAIHRSTRIHLLAFFPFSDTLSVFHTTVTLYIAPPFSLIFSTT